MVSSAAGDPLSLTIACRHCQRGIRQRCKGVNGLDCPTHRVRVVEAATLWAARIAWIRHTIGRVST